MSQIKVNSIIPVSGVPTGGGGGIIQIVEAVKTDTATTSTSIYGAIAGLQPQITPTSNTSKIMMLILNYLEALEEQKQKYFLVQQMVVTN